MDKEQPGKAMVSRQTVYMAILVSLTMGFMLGAAYTSFKLADDANVAKPENPHVDGAMQEDHLAEAGSGILKLQKFLKDNPDDANGWAKLGDLYFDTSRFGDAIKAYEKSLALKPGNPVVLTDMGVMFRRNKQPQKAIEAFDQAIAADPGFETAMFNKGVVLMHDLNDSLGAVRAWEALVEKNPMAVGPGGELVKNLLERIKQKP